jgi:hypothetical protein
VAWLIDQMHPDVPVGLLGYSFGAQAVTGALHALGGGAIGGQTLTRVHPLRRPPSAATLGAAMPARWVDPGQRHGLAISQVERFLITVNPSERTLRFYRGLRFNGGGPVLGNTGVLGLERHGAAAERVDHFCTEPYNGKRHFFKVYMGQPEITSRLTGYVFPLPIPAAVSEPVFPEAPAPAVP